MKSIVNHEIFGELVYDESVLTGKRRIFQNGVELDSLSKTEYLIDGKNATLAGNYMLGASLTVDGEVIELVAKPKWYEFVLAILPFIVIMVWGNNIVLCSIFPVVGGAIGGLIGGLGALMSMVFMKKTANPLYKILIGVGMILLSMLLSFIVAILIILALA